MKKFGIILFIFFICIASVYAVLQSNIGKNLTRDLLLEAFKDTDYQVHIGQVEGTIPTAIDLKNVSIEGEGVEVEVKEVNLRLVLWRLLKNELAFNSIDANQISWKKSPPFDFSGKLRMNKKKGYLKGKLGDWVVDARLDRRKRNLAFLAKGEFFQVKGEGIFDGNYQLMKGNALIESDRLFSKLPFQVLGKLVGNVELNQKENGYDLSANWEVPHLTLENTKVSAVRGEGKAFWQEGTLLGDLKILGKISKDLWNLKTHFSWVNGGNLSLTSLEISSPRARGSGNFTIHPNWQIVGTSELALENLQAIEIPDLYGKVLAKSQWGVTDQKQTLKLDIDTSDFFYQSFSAQKITIYSDLIDPFGKVKGNADLQVEKGKWDGLEIELASIQTENEVENWPFKLYVEGEWKHPLELKIEGIWRELFDVEIRSLSGKFFNHPFTLEKPMTILKKETIFQLSNTKIKMANGGISFHINREKDDTNAHLIFNQLPIDFLSVNPLDVPISGTLNLEADLKERKNQLKGNFKASIDDLEIENKGSAAGVFTGQFNHDRLEINGKLSTRNQPLLNVDLSLPIHFSVWPFGYGIHTHKPVDGLLSLHGRIEDFLDFFDLGLHRLEGDSSLEFTFSNTLYQPSIEGSATLKKGYYQNYYTGTELYDIEANFHAKNDRIILSSLTAKDFSRKGQVTARGEMAMLISDLFPFKLDLEMADFQFAEIDLVSAQASGEVQIEGNITSAIAKGDIEVIKSDLQIPDHIPHSLPELKVVYRHATRPIVREQNLSQPYPLFLDLNVTAPQGISIGGRGLTSEWNGNFHLGGTFTDLAAKGKLELIDGEFNFSSRSFKLTEGALTLSGKEHEMPYINLAGSMHTKGITIIARLKGPLNNPQISLQSNPPLPLGSIMSHLLFGQDLSDISGFQALQLANSLASLAGTGPDIMESTRKSLGVDRLRVITDPTEEGGESVSIQVGKYVSEGVLVSFTQGTEDRGTNISIEVELKNNFVLQLESDQQPSPQGKFSLKWNLNY